MKEFMSYVAGVGFPIAVSAFVLIRLENAMKNLTKAIDTLVESIKH